MLGRPIALMLALITLLSGCSGEKPLPITSLVVGGGDRNVQAMVQAVQELCIDRVGNAEEFDAAVRASGWGWQQTQKIDEKNPLSLEVWALPDARLIRGTVSPDRIYICTLQLKAGTAPTLEATKRALAELAGMTPSRAAEWSWAPTPNRRAHMDVAEGQIDLGDYLGVTLEIDQLPWWQSLLGK